MTHATKYFFLLLSLLSTPLAHKCETFEVFKSNLEHFLKNYFFKDPVNEDGIWELYDLDYGIRLDKSLKDDPEFNADLKSIYLETSFKENDGILIGEGRYGSVYSALRKTDNDKWQPASIKYLNIGKEKSVLEFLNEVQILCSFLGKPNILQIIDFGIVSVNEFGIVTEMASGNVQQLIKQEKLSTKQKFSIIYDIINAVEVVHKAEFVHGDIKLSNFLYFRDDEKISVKLADFGLSSMKPMVNFSCGTREYIAPEIEFLNERKHEIDGRPSDIFSLSVVIRKILDCKRPIIPNMENSNPDKRPTIGKVKESFLEYENHKTRISWPNFHF